MKKYTPLLALTVAILAGCATGEATKTTSKNYTATDPSSVEILFEKPARAYTTIGFVSGTGAKLASQDAVFAAMREEAAKIGADAVLMRSDISEQTTFTGNANMPVVAQKKGNALAIKWTDGLPQNLPIQLKK
jgi:hypothetical protein